MLVSHGVDFILDLGEDVGGVVVVGLLDLLLSELGDFTGFEALLVFEKAVRTSEEAVEGDNLLQEAELRRCVSLVISLLLGRDLLLELSLNLVVDFRFLLVGGNGLFDEGGDLLHVGLGIKLDGLAHESHRDKCFRKLADGSSDIGTLSLHFSSRSISK